MKIGLRWAAVVILAAGAVMAAPPAAPVVFGGKTLFTLREGVGEFSPQERVKALTDRLETLERTPDALIRIAPEKPGATGTEIDGGGIPLLVVTDQDALAAGKPRPELAKEWAASMESSVEQARKAHGIRRTILDFLMALAFVGLLFGVLRLQRILFRRLRVGVRGWRGTRIRGLRIQDVELLSDQKITNFLVAGTRLLQTLTVLLAFYLFLSLLLGILPETRGISATLLAYIWGTIAAAWRGLAAAVPGLIVIVMIGVVTWYILKLCRFLFGEIEKGTITFPGFYPEWAIPTYKLVRIVVLACAAVAAFPYVPGGESPAFKGISIFFGLLVSLGSAGAVGNIIAGVLLTYTRAFQIGDRVKIDDTIGDITERTLLATRLRTVKNEDVTVPNSLVLSGQIFNYTTCCRDSALILHTSVTIGYDAPWRQVHELLIAAALRTGNVLEEPKPFVLQTALNDFYVNYQINAYTSHPAEMLQIYSDLHQNIQDAFNNAGVEICSPHFAALRDANRIAIPDEYIPKDYAAPSFRVSTGPGTADVRGTADGLGGGV